MPNIKSAKKRVLIIEKKRSQNRVAYSQMKTAIRKIEQALAANDIPLAESLLPEVFSVIDKACTKGVIHANNAANKKSGLASRIDAIKSGKVTVVIKKDNKTIAKEKAQAAAEQRAALRAETLKRKQDKAEAKLAAEKAKAEAEKAAKKAAKAKAKPKADAPSAEAPKPAPKKTKKPAEEPK